MTRARDLASGSGIEAGEVLPHIIPDVLYPSYVASGTSNKLLDGTTAHSGAFGTAQSDGRKYYYTNIAGSKPIKDPRIGAHFGSQRHKTRSVQLLEQETATHGENVYSVDGREWMRYVAPNLESFNNEHGTWFQIGSFTTGTNWLEFTGYFNAVNWSALLNSSTSDVNLAIDGTANSSVFTGGSNSVLTPLGSRYVDASSLINLIFDSTPTLGIHTVKISNVSGDYFRLWGIELIAQDKFTDATCDYNNDPTITHDANTKILAGMSVSGTGIPAGAKVASVTSSTAFELSASTTGGAVTNGTLTFGTTEISIPAQNVVSYGKKFAIPATAQHYDPFNGFTNGSSVTAYVDTATSLGVEAWKNSSTYYRPYNGGRVVKWVDSSGTIKTSVNMMPPNARSIGNSATLTNATAKANASIANNTFYPTMEAGAIDHSLAEVAKTFHWREFGNGSANSAGGGGTSNTYADASMLHTSDSIGYVMDDGLTSLTGENVSDNNANYLIPDGDGDTVYYTFIGTGVSFKSDVSSIGIKNIAQNLPYGTHILKYLRGGTHKIYIDGVEVDSGNLYGISEITFHQPKMPPIPEDAVIIADYMLMADFVKQTDAEPTEISKGVRYCSGSRDHFYGGANAGGTNVSVYSFGITGGSSPSGSNGTGIWKLPFFGTTGLSMMENSNVAHTVKLNDSATNQTALDNSVSTAKDMISIAETVTLGQTSIESTLIQGSYHFMGHIVASPIHTSSHYQTFETPFLNELVGGDRNMEQNNLIVTPDGKSWDEVTRDTSYIGNCVVNTATDSETSWSTSAKFDEWRGMSFTYYPLMNKDFAIAYDRIICLVDGEYTIIATTRATGAGQNAAISINGTDIINANLPTDNQQFELSTSLPLKRGDYVMFKGSFGTSLGYNRFIITRL